MGRSTPVKSGFCRLATAGIAAKTGPEHSSGWLWINGSSLPFAKIEAILVMKNQVSESTSESVAESRSNACDPLGRTDIDPWAGR